MSAVWVPLPRTSEVLYEQAPLVERVQRVYLDARFIPNRRKPRGHSRAASVSRPAPRADADKVQPLTRHGLCSQPLLQSIKFKHSASNGTADGMMGGLK